MIAEREPITAKRALQEAEAKLLDGIAENDRQNKLFTQAAGRHAERAERLRAELAKLRQDMEWIDA